MASDAERLKHYRGHVYSAIRPIAQAIAGQPIRVGRINKGTKPRGLRSLAPEVVELIPTHEVLDTPRDPSPALV